MGQIYTERKESGNDKLPILTVSIHTGVSDGALDETELGKRVKRSEDKSTYKIARKNDLVFNMMRAWQGAIGTVRTTGMVSPAYIVAYPNDLVEPIFMDYLVKCKQMIDSIHRLSYGVTDFRLRLYWDSFVEIPINVPSLEEQNKIASFLTLLDKRIAKQRELVENLKSYKRGVLSAIFSRKIRFSDSEWISLKVSDVLDYEQPQKYIVDTENYSDSYNTPVLTANKAFILGYTDELTGIYDKGDVIIYDDFTMDCKYVTFPFKVKSSTIKMLTSKGENNLYYLYSLLEYLNLQPEGHQRSYISIVEPMIVQIAPTQEQNTIALFLKTIDNYIECNRFVLQTLENEKKALYQQLFI